MLTEQVFSLPGLGKYAIDAIRNNDLPMVLGVTLLAAFFIVVANLIVDLLYAVVDPRVRCWADGPDGTEPFLEVKDLTIHFATDDGVVAGRRRL